ncbi:MAG: pitrilysin family protein [Parvularculaceae bacterium]
MMRFNILLAAALALSTPVWAEEAPPPPASDFPTAPPAGSEPRPFKLPAVETYTLKNGLTVTLATYGAAPKATVRAVVRVGNANDGDSPWVSDLTSDMMQEGAAGKTGAELDRTAASMGGDLNIGVGLDETFAGIDVLSESADEAVGLVADVLQRPDFPASEFEKNRQNNLRALSVARSEPQSLANDAFTGLIYPDHPYARAQLPPAEKIAAMTLDDVKAFHAANFGAKRTHLYVVGQFDRRVVKKAIGKAFGDWAEGPAPLVMPPGAARPSQVGLVDRPSAVQSTIRLGKRVPPIDGTLELEAADTILGGYFSSRITRNIREDKGYTYSPNSAVSAEYRAAYWRQNADITTESTGLALAEVMKEIRGLQDAPPSAAELDGVKNYMNGIYVIGLASRQGMAGQLAYANLHGLGLKYLESYVSLVRALTPEQVQAAARNNLDIEEMSLVVVGDLAKVRTQIEKLPEFSGKLPPRK